MLSSITWGEYHPFDCDDNLSSEAVKFDWNNENLSRKFLKKKLTKLMQLHDPTAFSSCIDTLRQTGILVQYWSHAIEQVNWIDLPASVHPRGGQLPTSRLWRKVFQVENMLSPCLSIIRALEQVAPTRKLKIVEFCAGSGYVVLPLAAIYPMHQFILIDYKGKSIEIGKQRIFDASLTNVLVIEDNIEVFNEPFDLGISLHACGGATDIVVEKCVRFKAAFVSCSCCIGKIISYRKQPLSKLYCQVITESSFRSLVKAGDFGHAELAQYTAEERMRRICKCYIEQDRILFANESGYDVRMLLMHPKDASPKNDILVGWPAKRIAGPSCSTNETAYPTESIFSSMELSVIIKVTSMIVGQINLQHRGDTTLEKFLFS